MESKRSYFKRSIMIGSIILIGLIIGTQKNTKIKYQENQKAIHGTIEIDNSNFIGVYVQNKDTYTKSDTIPESGYEFNQEESYCKIGNTNQENI